jgi:hypothetical protein
MSEDWIYRRADRLPFALRLSRKALHCSRAGLMKWRKAKLDKGASMGERGIGCVFQPKYKGKQGLKIMRA